MISPNREPNNTPDQVASILQPEAPVGPGNDGAAAPDTSVRQLSVGVGSTIPVRMSGLSGSRYRSRAGKNTS